MKRAGKNLVAYTTFGIAFGCCFPVFAILADIFFFKELPFAWESVGKAHFLNPLHFIIDTAPLFLGLAFSFVGFKQDQLIEINQKLQRVFEETLQQKEEISTQRDLLHDKNQEVERKSQDLQSSIQYAQTIQNAILPDMRFMQMNLDNLFVLHKARDIVSGDFYYFTRKAGKSIVAVADCTGHGIPASFMTLIGYQHLNNIILQQGILEPNIILECLHEGIYSTLRQGETQNSDGMDIGLCIIDKENNRIEFAGSKISLHYIRQDEIHRLKGSSTYIGGRDYKRQPFDKQVLPLLEDLPTQFYLFSDGYQDQFGSPQNTKFLSSRLKTLLLKVHTLPANEQRRILLITIENWIGEGAKEQTDDILVVGFTA